MSGQLLAQLQRSGALRAVDVEFGQLLARLDPAGGDALALVAAAASQAIAHGHSCLPLQALPELLAGPAAGVVACTLPDSVELRGVLDASPLAGRLEDPANTPLVWSHGRVWLRRYAAYERLVADSLRARAQSLRALPDAAALRARIARWFKPGDGVDWQAVAVALGLRAHLAIISGGPGTGKTTSVLWLLAALLEEAQATGQPLPRIRLAAPTGKAAARLAESLRAGKATLDCDEAVLAAIHEDEASTLHRLLGYHPQRGFRFHRDRPVAADVVVVDEASMVDLPLMAHLLDALAPGTALVLLGDVGQLASVEAGHVLASIGPREGGANTYSGEAARYLEAVTGHVLPRAAPSQAALADCFVELRRRHRFGGGIGELAQAIRAGDADAALRVLQDGRHDVAQAAADARALERLREGGASAQLRALADCASPAEALALSLRYRILTALREGPSGCVAINRALEQGRCDSSGWYHGRLVMVTANDYRHALFNGDIGVAWREPGGRLQVWFPGDGATLRAFSPYTLPAHESALAMTVHKSQGSEFEEVAVVLPETASRVLGRELLYTAVTRARQRVVVHGGDAIVRAAIDRPIERWSGLPDLLRA